MKTRIIPIAAVLLVLLLLGILVATAPRHPVALIKVVDATGNAVAGVTIKPEGLRTKPGPYRSGWYGWKRDSNHVPNNAVTTDANGLARVPYPKFVFELIETGTLCLSVNHPDYVPDRPECVVATAPPAGAPWQVRLADLWSRVRHKAWLAEPDPIVLEKGAILEVSVNSPAPVPTDARLFVQTHGLDPSDADTWTRPRPEKIVTRRLGAGARSLRAVLLHPEGKAWFSETITIKAQSGATNQVSLPLKPGSSVRGRLDERVPRPVTRGRVISHVWPKDSKPKEYPPTWHQWSPVEEDGSFFLPWLPPGDLEVVALCDGFVSTHGPGQFNFRYPQKHVLGTNDLSITIGMEPTARLEVKVFDDQGKPLTGAMVMSWPNARYGDWSAVILAGDCHNTADLLMHSPADESNPWRHSVPDFEGTSDRTGLAVLPNVPADVATFGVQHANFVLPSRVSPDGRQFRQGTVKLVAGETNRISVQLERNDGKPIAHY